MLVSDRETTGPLVIKGGAILSFVHYMVSVFFSPSALSIYETNTHVSIMFVMGRTQTDVFTVPVSMHSGKCTAVLQVMSVTVCLVADIIN